MSRSPQSAGDRRQPGHRSTEEFMVTFTARLFMLTGPLCKEEPASPKQKDDFESDIE